MLSEVVPLERMWMFLGHQLIALSLPCNGCNSKVRCHRNVIIVALELSEEELGARNQLYKNVVAATTTFQG